MLSPESNIYYLLFSIPLPSPNQCIVIPNVPALEWTQSSTAASFTLIFQRPSVHSELPLFENEIGQVIDLEMDQRDTTINFLTKVAER